MREGSGKSGKVLPPVSSQTLEKAVVLWYPQALVLEPDTAAVSKPAPSDLCDSVPGIHTDVGLRA